MSLGGRALTHIRWIAPYPLFATRKPQNYSQTHLVDQHSDRMVESRPETRNTCLIMMTSICRFWKWGLSGCTELRDILCMSMP